MTLFRTALKNFRKDPLMNIIGFVQLIAVILVTTVMVSAISIRYRTYDPVKDILSGKGFYAVFGGELGAGGWIDGEGYTHHMTADELFDSFSAESAVIVMWDELYTHRTYPGVKENNSPPMMLYDREMLSRYAPDLKSGRMPDPDSDVLELVITDENAFGWSLGDVIQFDVGVPIPPDYLIPAEARIVGIVESSADIFGYNSGRDAVGDTYRLMYDTHNAENWDHLSQPTILASADAYTRLYPDTTPKISSAIFTYGSGAPDELIKEDGKTAGKLGAGMVIDLKTMNAESREYLHDELLKLLPVIAVLLVLVVISAVSVSAIAARRRLKDYAKYYVLGLRWRQCAVVSLLQALVTSAAAIIISAAALFIADFTPLAELVTVIINARLILSLLGILALYLVFSMIMPMIMLNSATPKELLQTE